MNNLSYVFAAFTLVTIVFLIHSFLMSSRQARLEKKLDELKHQMNSPK